MNRNARERADGRKQREKHGAPEYKSGEPFPRKCFRQKPDVWKQIIFRYCQGTALLAASGLLILAVWLQDGEAVRRQKPFSGGTPVTAEAGETEAAAAGAEQEAGKTAANGAGQETGKAAANGAKQETGEAVANGAEQETEAAGSEPDDTAEISAQEAISADEETKRAALTFDDGPHSVYTKMLLDGLKERQICATFFVIGENITGNEDLIKRMAEEGHIIGNHTYNHVKISEMDPESACEQVEKTSSLVKTITGQDTEFVRPPFGEWNKALEEYFVMIPVLWDVDPLDWTTKNTDTVVRRVLTEVSDGDIILLHDCYESSVLAALRIADTLTAQGWEFVTVDELILE